MKKIEKSPLSLVRLMCFIAAPILFFTGIGLLMTSSIGKHTFYLFKPELYLFLSAYSLVIALILLSNKIGQLLFKRRIFYIFSGIFLVIVFLTLTLTKLPTYHIQTIADASYRIPWYMTHTYSGNSVDFLVCQDNFIPFESDCSSDYTHVRVYEPSNITQFSYKYFFNNKTEGQFYSVQDGSIVYTKLPEETRIIDMEHSYTITNSHDDYIGRDIYFFNIAPDTKINALVMCSIYICDHYVYDTNRVIWFQTKIKSSRQNTLSLHENWQQDYKKVFERLEDLQI